MIARNTSPIRTVGIIGTGKVAHFMANALQQAPFKVQAVWGRSAIDTKLLANEVGANAYLHIQQLPAHLDIYVIAVSDGAIADVSDTLEVNGLVVHTSGSVSIDVLNKHAKRGVFYPLQTITKETKGVLKTIPLLLEVNDLDTQQLLIEMAGLVSKEWHWVTSVQRQSLHLAAVFANNFTNHLFGVAKQILHHQHLPTHLLNQLIEQTAKNAIEHHPFDVQTGPVVRNDVDTIQLHLQLLQKYPNYRQLYELLSASIAAHKPEKK